MSNNPELNYETDSSEDEALPDVVAAAAVVIAPGFRRRNAFSLSSEQVAQLRENINNLPSPEPHAQPQGWKTASTKS